MGEKHSAVKTFIGHPNTEQAGQHGANVRASVHCRSANTTLPNGNMDPWHSLSVVNQSDPFAQSCVGENICDKQQLGENDHLVFIDGTAHCRDMYVYTNTDTPPHIHIS